jgi:hypothetical protein
LDDSKAKFINGGVGDETKVTIKSASSDTSFTGLGKDELKKYAEDPFWVRLRWILFILFWVCWLAMLVSAIVIIVLAPRCPTRPDLKWYHKDAAYNVYAKSFYDGDPTQDGYGDLDGKCLHLLNYQIILFFPPQNSGTLPNKTNKKALVTYRMTAPLTQEWALIIIHCLYM